MKNLALFACIILLSACGNQEETTSTPATQAVAAASNADSISMADGLHSFFKWYAETGEQLITKINFVNHKGPHPSLDEALLNTYFEAFEQSGTVSPLLIENEKAFYRNCAVSWQEEASGEVISCMDYDRYFCGQDYEPKEFLSAGVMFKTYGNRAKVKLLLDNMGPNGGPRDFEMQKENGKWLLSKLVCN